jgi:hypothetical protein
MTDDSDPIWPTPGPNRPTIPSDEYRQLEQAVNDYLDADDTERPIRHALGAILGEYKRDRFAAAHDLDRPAEQACIRRLITGEDSCPHDALEADPDPDGPPHSPPASDHATLWLDADGEPAVYSMHVYPGNIERLDAAEPPYNQWFDLFEFARQWGLEVSINPTSWYNLGGCVHVFFYPPERYRSTDD